MAKEEIRKADRAQDRYNKYHIEAREAQEQARRAPYKQKVAKKMK